MNQEFTDIDLSKAQTEAEWLARLDELGEEVGSFDPLGRRHAAFFCRGNDKVLLVTFEIAAEIRAAGGRQRPLGYEIAGKNSWSSLTLVARGQSWFRDPAVWDHFDRLIDDGVFEGFDQVVFFGTGPCGYAAASYSVAAPGATVLTVAPQATLDTARAEWDTRFPQARRLDFTSRFGYAPDMIEAAAQMTLIYDPARRLDAMHASLFHGANVTALRTRWLGRDTAGELMRMNVLTPALELACQGALTRASFFRLFRRRQSLASYVARIVLRTESLGRPRLTVLAARAALRIAPSERVKTLLEQAEARCKAPA